MTVLDISVTLANIHDNKLFSPFISNALSSNLSDLIKEAYGDNAYDTSKNHKFCIDNIIKVSLHSKEETGKNPRNPRSVKMKSKKRSKIETIFGIAHENLGFGAVRVRSLWSVLIDTSIIYTSWNLGIVYSFYTDLLQDRISLKRLLYRN